MMISVVIPAFNEELTLERCLLALELQTLSPEEFEVLLIDNGSKDRTLEVVGTFLDRLPLRIATKLEPGVSGVRNFGAQLASGEILAFLDADCLAPPHWLEQAVALRPEGAVWGADYRVPEDATWVGRIWARYQASEQVGDVSFLPAGCLFIAKEDFFRIGAFDQSIETSEDVELCARARKNGLQVIAVPALAVSHEGTPRTLRRFYRQNRWHGKHVLRVFLDHLPSSKNLGIVAVSAYTLVVSWLCLAGLLLAVFRLQASLFLVPAALLILPTLLLALRKTLRTRRLQDALPLWALYETYFLARAASLTRGVSRGQR